MNYTQQSRADQLLHYGTVETWCYSPLDTVQNLDLKIAHPD